jgi:hypothetical protein
METCSNPNCTETAKSKCSACSTVAYCGQDCQKAHWTLHKKACKAARTGGKEKENIEVATRKNVVSANPNPFPVGSVLYKLQESKIETKSLPEPSGSVEAIQIHLNMATAYLQLKKAPEAKIHSGLCVEIAERAITMRQNDPQVFSVSLSLSL